MCHFRLQVGVDLDEFLRDADDAVGERCHGECSCFRGATLGYESEGAKITKVTIGRQWTVDSARCTVAGEASAGRMPALQPARRRRYSRSSGRWTVHGPQRPGELTASS